MLLLVRVVLLRRLRPSKTLDGVSGCGVSYLLSLLVCITSFCTEQRLLRLLRPLRPNAARELARRNLHDHQLSKEWHVARAKLELILGSQVLAARECLHRLAREYTTVGPVVLLRGFLDVSSDGLSGNSRCCTRPASL